MPQRGFDLKLARRLTITLVVFALYTIGRFGIDQIRPPGLIPNDYLNFHHAADRLNAGLEIYEPSDSSPFKYSPTFLVAFAASFDRLPHAWAWGVWCALSIFGFAWATRWLWVNGLPRELSGRALAGLIALFGVFFWHGYIEHFSYGQGDMFVFAVFILAVSARRDLSAAFFMSALLCMKPQAAILLAYFLVGRRWRMLGATVAFTTALLLVPALGWGWAKQMAYFARWRGVLSSQSVEFMAGNLNQSVAATLARLTGHRELVMALTPLIVALGGLIALLAVWAMPLPARATGPEKARTAVGTLLLYALVCPLSWRWSTFVWLPVGVWIGARAWAPWLPGASGALKSHRPAFRPAALTLAAFALIGLLLQTFIAHALGIAEIDELSRLGLYTIGNALLAGAFMLATGLLPRSASSLLR